MVLSKINIALAIASEWDDQQNKRLGIQPVNMPMMSLAATAIDQISLDPEESISTCLKYLPTDTCLFLTTELDRILLAKQKKHLIPLVEWLNEELGIKLVPTDSVAGKINHSQETISRVRSMLEKMV